MVRKKLVQAVLAAGIVLAPLQNHAATQGEAQSRQQAEQKEKESGPQRQDPSQPADMQRGIARILRDLQFALERGSAQGLLSLIDSAKFRDYASFQDTVERLVREDTIRAYFRQESWSAAEGKARSRVDAEMELARKNATGQVKRRRQQLELELERTPRGWRITNIIPRNFFEPF